MTIAERIDAAYAFIRSRTDLTPEVGLILGSGLGDFADRLESAEEIPFAQIPGFPVPTVEGHAGALILGSFQGRTVAALRGRIHYYEGYSQQEITLPVRVMARLGIRTLVLTNAAGGVNLDFSAGALMLIADHINFSGMNPLMGPNLEAFGPRFPDMSNAYDKELRTKAKELAKQENISLAEGVYLMVSGPTFETPSEVRAFRILGADVVGMSTVPEVICAVHSGMKVLGFSVVVNLGCGLKEGAINHAETLREADKASANLIKLVRTCIREI